MIHKKSTKFYFVFLLSIIIIGCNTRNKITTDDTDSISESADIVFRENIPFDYDESGILFKGAFNVSPDYFAELILNTETTEFIIFINGEKTFCELPFEDPEILLPGICVNTEDFNQDGYVDFCLIPNCSARFPESYVYFFDSEKEYFVLAEKENNDEYAHRYYINNTVGFISINHETPDSINKITFLNDDETIWMTFMADDFGNVIDWHEDFHPWALESGIMVFAVRCVEKNDDGYRVIVNEGQEMEKQLLKHKNIEFSTIEEHLLTILIDFDIKQNPIRETPDDNGEILFVDDLGDLINVVEVNGDWIKIRDLYNDKILGWIKWREKNEFLIDFYYSV
ncbi:SH3 domain-containing protein [Bacteroidales bacterium OttesenSCG-928-I21]|nr:SH3 domain-containing protein [Bacteroidales bacterium OttesenSCG-928-I21]